MFSRLSHSGDSRSSGSHGAAANSFKYGLVRTESPFNSQSTLRQDRSGTVPLLAAASDGAASSATFDAGAS